MGNKSGYILIEVLFSMSISFFILTSIFFSLQPLSKINVDLVESIDIDVASKQLSQLLIKASSIYENEGTLYFIIDNEINYLEYHQGRLVKKEGYEIVLFNIDSVTFEQGDYWTIKVKRNNKEYVRIIGVATNE